MLNFLKNVKVILSILLVLSWIGAGVGGYLYHNSKQKELAEKDSEIDSLQYSINQIGELVTAYTVVTDVKMGKEILETDLEPIQVPISMSTNLVLDIDEIVGKHYKLDLTKGTAISLDTIYEEELTDDLRLYDVVLDMIPVGLQKGSYVDVRITLPMGEDFIAMSHKRVYDINGGILKLGVTEEDLHAYNSMLVDSLFYPGTQLYAVEYVEGGVQAPADTYYPISKNVIAIAQKDPNLLTAIKSDILQRRDTLEEGLSTVVPDERDENEIQRILDRGRSIHRASFTDAEREFIRKQERNQAEEREREREAQRQAERERAEQQSNEEQSSEEE